MLHVPPHHRARRGNAPTHFVPEIDHGPLLFNVVTVVPSCHYGIAHCRGIHARLPIHGAPTLPHGLEVMARTVDIKAILWKAKAFGNRRERRVRHCGPVEEAMKLGLEGSLFIRGEQRSCWLAVFGRRFVPWMQSLRQLHRLLCSFSNSAREKDCSSMVFLFRGRRRRLLHLWLRRRRRRRRRRLGRLRIRLCSGVLRPFHECHEAGKLALEVGCVIAHLLQQLRGWVGRLLEGHARRCDRAHVHAGRRCHRGGWRIFSWSWLFLDIDSSGRLWLLGGCFLLEQGLQAFEVIPVGKVQGS